MNTTEFIIFFLVFIRIISFLGTSPIFMIKGIPNPLKVGLGLLMALLISNFVNYDARLLPVSLVGLVAAAAGECLSGLVLGYISTLALYGMQMAGQLIDLQIGFSMINQYDPLSSNNVTILGNLNHLVGLMTFFMIDGHHMLIKVLIESFQVIPLLGVNIPPEVGPYIVTLLIKIVILSLKLAAPVVIVLFITDFTMGLIARTVPQLNIFMLGMPLKIVVGLLAFSAALPGILHVLEKAFQEMQGDISNYFKLFPMVIMFASGDKTEEATPKKKEDARKKGQVAKSRELISAVTLVGITIIVVSFGDYCLRIIEEFLTGSLENAGKTILTQGDVSNAFIYSTIEFMKITLPFFAGIMVLGVISNIAQTGFIHSGEPMKPKLDRLNPIEGFKRMFSGKAFMELVKSIANVLIVGYAVYSFLKGVLPDIIKTSDMGLNSLLDVSGNIIQKELLRVSIIVGALGIIDFVYQKYTYTKELRMTKQEVKEEFKQMEGDPQIKSRIRQRQRQMASRRMMHEVPKASVVITNPTHLAIALKYEQGGSDAPVVVAKGADALAFRIRKVAEENKIPIVENKPAARMIFEKVEIGESIPYEMYQVVAEILAAVYNINNKRTRG